MLCIFLLTVCARRPRREVENGSIDSPDDKRAVFQSLGDKDEAAFGEYELFIAHPELDLDSQVIRVFRVGAD